MKYPWTNWSDGAWHRVRQSDVPRTFREMVRNHARRTGLRVGIRRLENGDLVFRLGERVEDGKFIGTNGQENPFIDEVPDVAEERYW